MKLPRLSDLFKVYHGLVKEQVGKKGRSKSGRISQQTKIRITFQVFMVFTRNPGGLMVRSLDCHAVDPGSIPSVSHFLFLKKIRLCLQILPKLLLKSSADFQILRRRTLGTFENLRGPFRTFSELCWDSQPLMKVYKSV